ncbi:hypothetical protein G3446_16770 [Thiorhodococcus minor]|uniref:Chemotaxis protein CheZ n=1 Tax=Thiorhodococcus minor TaxID=57489 RepID=A0A6M0K1A1_9GAMM|nr:hypothetical protein [Thiorhodococcus minor]
MDTTLESLVQATESILNGEFDQLDVEIDAEGMVSLLAQKINSVLVNMRSVETPLTSAGHQAPTAVSSAKSVVDLMAQATRAVLDSSDVALAKIETLEASLKDPGVGTAMQEERLGHVKACFFDIIASQSYQDAARQRMDALILDLDQIRGWLVEALVILNIQKDDSFENKAQKAKMLRDVTELDQSDSFKQDLVDDLLSEYGL